MSKNPLYANEIATANKFIIEHNTDIELQNFLSLMRDMQFISHSERWSKCYDFLHKYYPENETGTIVTGLAYWLES